MNPNIQYPFIREEYFIDSAVINIKKPDKLPGFCYLICLNLLFSVLRYGFFVGFNG